MSLASIQGTSGMGDMRGNLSFERTEAAGYSLGASYYVYDIRRLRLRHGFSINAGQGFKLFAGTLKVGSNNERFPTVSPVR